MHPSSSFHNMQLTFMEAFKNMIICFSSSLIRIQGIYHDGNIYFKAKLDTKLIKDAPSFYENSMLLKKQSLEVCKPRVLIWVQWGALGIPKLMVFTILGFLLVWYSSIPCEKNFNTKLSSHSFLWGDIRGTKKSYLLLFYSRIKLYLHE